MANPTTNFGWQMPTATDLVTDLPADFEVFGQAVDTDFVDLLGGTTGQVLSKTTDTDLDFTWVDSNPGDITGVTAGTGISGGGTSGDVTITNSMATAITTAGDLIKGTGSGTFDRLGIGSTDDVLTVVGGVPTWAAPAAASVNYAGVLLTTSVPGQSIANNTWTKVSFNTETFDVGGYAASGSTITIPTGKDGYYRVSGSGYSNPSTTGYRQIGIYKNGSQIYASSIYPAPSGSTYPTSTISQTVSVVATDTIELYVWQNSGGALAFNAESGFGWLGADFLGA
jgi:hypothetical protein